MAAAEKQTLSKCCITGFKWNGTPVGIESTLANNKAYVTGPEDAKVAILYIHDALGWNWHNARLLADHYAEGVGARVFLPDFFGGEVLDQELLLAGKFDQIDIRGFTVRNDKPVRFPEMLACARDLRAKYSRVGTIGFCYGGWAVFQLGAEEFNPKGSDQPKLVDCISTGHPSLLTKEEIDKIAVHTQIIAPEVDYMYSQEMKDYSNTVIPTKGVAYDYQHFPGEEHGFATKGHEKERPAFERAANAAVHWFNQWLNV